VTKLENWNRSAESHPHGVENPKSVADVVEIVTDTDRFPAPVRAAGKLHSTTFCIEADGGTQLRMDHFGKVEVSDDGRRITAGAGVTMLQIRDALRPRGRELAVSPEIGNATAGSVACSGSKDSWLRSRSFPEGLAQIGSAVVSVTMVNARGEVLVVDETGATVQGSGRRDPTPTLGLVRCSYGLLGIIVEVTFDTVALTLLENRFVWLPVADPYDPAQSHDTIFVPTVSQVFGEADAVLAFLQPYRGGILAERRRVAGPGEPSAEDRARRALRDWIWEWGASESVTALVALSALLGDGGGGHPLRTLLATGIEAAHAAVTEHLPRVLAGHLPLPTLRADHGGSGVLRDAAAHVRDVLSAASPPVADHDSPLTARLLRLFDNATGPFFEALLQGYRSYRSDSLVDFTDRRETFFDFTFWAYPEGEWDTIVPAYIRFCRDYARQHGEYRPALFTEVYFIGQDTHSVLSFSADGPVFTLDMVDNRPTDPRWRAMNRAYNAWAADHGGRPLLNQTKELEATPGVIARAYGNAWQRFSQEVWAANPATAAAPDGRFVSGYFARLLAPRPTSPPSSTPPDR